MSEENYLDYTPSALEYTASKARKIKKIIMKGKQKDSLMYKLVSVDHANNYNDNLSEESSKEITVKEEIPLTFERMVIQQIKQEKNNFTSFRPLPDEFMEAVKKKTANKNKNFKTQRSLFKRTASKVNIKRIDSDR